MAGTSKNISAAQIHQGPGDLWIIGTPPVDLTSPRVVLASDGTPDSVTHGTCVHLGAISEATFGVKPDIATIDVDTLDAPIGGMITKLATTLEATAYQIEMAKLARSVGLASYSTASGYKQMTFGGVTALTEVCVAAISPKPLLPNQHLVAVLYKALASGGFSMALGRAKNAEYKLKFIGLGDLARTAGQQVGCAFKTTTDAAGGTPTAKDWSTAEIQQGPADLWIVAAAPTNSAVRVTLDASTLTPDSTAHATSVHMGATEGPVTISVEPEIAVGYVDQVEFPLTAYITQLKAKMEAEMSQAQLSIMAKALGVGTYASGSGYEQLTLGGSEMNAPICVAAIQKKLSDPTKAVVACLYRVIPSGGITISMSRRKRSTYKVSFEGTLDISRTAGKQMGVIHEMIA